MYQYTTTTIINSSLDSNGTTAKFTGSSTQLAVTRVGTFLKANIVYLDKRPYAAGVKEVASVTVPTLTTGKVARITIDIRLSESTYSEYANTHLFFNKPIVAEVVATGTAATDAAALIVQINSIKDRFGSNYVVAASGGGAVITLTAVNFNQRFYLVEVSEETANANSITQVDYIAKATGSVTTAGKLGFGDDEWMIKAVMVPTLDNSRYFGLNKEERPILGGNYTQYILKYSVTKDHNDGIVANGTSVTYHVFWVPATLVSAWETELDKLNLSDPYDLTLTHTTSLTLSTGSDETDQIVATGATGAVTYSVDQPTRALVGATTGLVTTAGVSGTGAAVITAVDAVGKTATITYTIAS